MRNNFNLIDVTGTEKSSDWKIDLICGRKKKPADENGKFSLISVNHFLN